MQLRALIPLIINIKSANLLHRKDPDSGVKALVDSKDHSILKIGQPTSNAKARTRYILQSPQSRKLMSLEIYMQVVYRKLSYARRNTVKPLDLNQLRKSWEQVTLIME